MSGSGPVIRVQQIPTADEKKGLANANPPASASNPYVTSNDLRLGGPVHKGDTGVPGAKGDTGVGVQGDTGADGTAGPAGGKGDTGTGVQGDTGAAGSASAVGDTGVKGDTGSLGAKGDTGSIGDTGVGVKGDTGTGVKGDTGTTGTSGIKGDTGSGVQGDTGVAGTSGGQGDTGIKGDTGGGAAVGYLDDLLDVTVPAPVTNQVLKWNGTAWVAAVFDENFTFSTASFGDDQASPQLVGTAASVWKAIGAINWTATYNNGTPDPTPHVAVSGYADSNLTGPNYTSGQNGVAYNYPAPDNTITFTLHATKGAVTDTSRTVTVTFNNYTRYGKTVETSGWDSADVMALAQSAISSSFTSVPGSGSVNAGAGEYLLYAHPSRYTTLHDDGFRYNGVTCPFELLATVSVTNNASGTPLTENYKVYRSTNANLGQATLSVATSAQIIGAIYWGISTVSNNYTQANILALTGGNSAISNTQQRTFSLTATLLTQERYVFAIPTRLNTVPDPVEIWINGVDQTGGFTKELESFTNVNGFVENYDIFYSNNVGLGAASVEIK